MLLSKTLHSSFDLLSLSQNEDSIARRQRASDLSHHARHLNDILLRHDRYCKAHTFLTSLHRDLLSLIPIQKAISYEQSIIHALNMMGIDLPLPNQGEGTSPGFGLENHISMLNQERIALYDKTLSIDDIAKLISTDPAGEKPGMIPVITLTKETSRLDGIRRAIYKNSLRLPIRHQYAAVCATIEPELIMRAKSSVFSGRGYLGRRTSLPCR